jgi:hypothetical protein
LLLWCLGTEVGLENGVRAKRQQHYAQQPV